jgi:hypothetical protein
MIPYGRYRNGARKRKLEASLWYFEEDQEEGDSNLAGDMRQE